MPFMRTIWLLKKNEYVFFFHLWKILWCMCSDSWPLMSVFKRKGRWGWIVDAFSLKKLCNFVFWVSVSKEFCPWPQFSRNKHVGWGEESKFNYEIRINLTLNNPPFAPLLWKTCNRIRAVKMFRGTSNVGNYENTVVIQIYVTGSI